ISPAQLELAHREAGDREPREADPRAGAARNLEQARLGRLDVGQEAQLRVVREVRKAAETSPSLLGERRLWMRAEELVAHLAPEEPRLRRVRRMADLRVQLEDPPLPVQEVERVPEHVLGLRIDAHAGLLSRERRW